MKHRQRTPGHRDHRARRARLASWAITGALLYPAWRLGEWVGYR